MKLYYLCVGGSSLYCKIFKVKHDFPISVDYLSSFLELFVCVVELIGLIF